MTQAEKLEALVRRAKENDPGVVDWTLESVTEDGSFLKVRDNTTGQIQLMDVWRFLYLHKVARALFKEGGSVTYYVSAHEPYDEPDYIDYWQYMLQQAVISPDPIDYMYKAVFGD